MEGGLLFSASSDSGWLRPPQNLPKTTWQRITALMVANILGTGVLSLADAASVLGWLPFAATLFIFTAGALYSGLLYFRLFAAAPSSRFLSDVAAVAYGKLGRVVVTLVVYVYIAGVTVIFHLTCTLAVAQVFYDSGICVYTLSAAVALPVFVLLQARELHSVGGLSVVGAVSILVPCVVVLAELIGDGRVAGAATEAVAAHSTIAQRGVAVMDVVFAYSGQVMFIELQADMAKPEHFPRAVYISLALMCAAYASVGSAGYWFIGEARLADGKPITSHVADGVARRVVNAFLAVHVLVAYVIEGNVLARGMARLLPTPQRDGATVGVRRTDRAWWAFCTLFIVGGAFTLSNLIPFFSDVMGLMASLCSVLITYTFPMLIARRLCRMRRVERVCATLLIPLSVAVAVAGTVASVSSILNKFHALPPFSCHVA